jgi:hypothetical protein
MHGNFGGILYFFVDLVPARDLNAASGAAIRRWAGEEWRWQLLWSLRQARIHGLESLRLPYSWRGHDRVQLACQTVMPWLFEKPVLRCLPRHHPSSRLVGRHILLAADACPGRVDDSERQ